MTLGVAPDATLDVAHEARARRWSYRSTDGRHALRSTELLLQADPRRERTAGMQVGPGLPVRVATCSAAEPDLAAAARQSLLAAGADVVATLRADDGMTFGERADALRAARADFVLIAAGDGSRVDGVAELCEALRFGCAGRAPAPRMLVSGEARAMMRLSEALSGFPIEVLSDPRRPDGHAAVVGRIRQFRRGADPSLVLRDETLEEVARALARANASDAVVLDVTGDSTSVVRSTYQGSLDAVHVPRLGVGRGADRVVARAGLDRVRRWIPWAVDAPSLLERVFNRARWPDAVPAEALALALEIALAHEAVAHALEDAEAAGVPVARLRGAPIVLVTGRAAALPRPAQSLLVVANALQPSAVSAIARDVDDALIACGALAATGRVRGDDPTEAIAAEIGLRREPLALLAACEPVNEASLRIVTDGDPREERLVRGAFYALPLRGIVELEGHGVRLRGRGEAGALGLVVDARGRPLALPARDAERVPTVAAWFGAVAAMPERAA